MTAPLPTPEDDLSPARPALATTPDMERLHLHMPIDIRSASLAVLALIASLFALRVASAFFIP